MGFLICTDCSPIDKKTDFAKKIGDTWGKGRISVEVFSQSPDWETENEVPETKETPRYSLYSCWLSPVKYRV